MIFKTWLTAVLVCLLTAGAAIGQASCPIESSAIENAKPNKLILYFPIASDAGFPHCDLDISSCKANAHLCTPGTSGCFPSPLSSGHVTPLDAFDIGLLTSYTGTVEALRDQIRDVVIDDYCEINVKVSETTTASTATFPRQVVVGIGTDSANSGSLFGEARSVDTGDATVFDAARVWAGTYQSLAGGTGGALNGANSTLQRWAFSIGGTAAHEGAHTYGLAHNDDFTEADPSNPCSGGTDHTKTGEDSLQHHLMAAGCHFTNEERAGFRRHFSDATFSILASNVGLSVETIHNWDFTNPNSGPASQLQFELLSKATALTPSWFYNGNMSPWTAPSVSSAIGTTTFKGATYNRFLVTWSAGQTWANGASGVVPGGANFHVGVTFSEADFGVPDAVIVSKVTLLDGGGTPLELQPRMVAYDTGALDAADGTYTINFFTADDPSRPLLLGNLTVSELPRVASINSMLKGVELQTWQGLPVKPWKSERKLCEKNQNLTTDGCFVPVRAAQSVQVAALRQGRHIVQKYDGKCPAGLRAAAGSADASKGQDGNECPSAGINVDLFPATMIYVTATVVDPNAKHWDPVSKSFVVGPLESHLFYQIAGRHPDLNRNGIDDFIDIATGKSKDTNGDGVPDEAQKCLKELRTLEACELERGNHERILADLRRREGQFPACEKTCSGRTDQGSCLRDCGRRLATLEHQEHEENEEFHRRRERCEKDLRLFWSCERRME